MRGGARIGTATNYANIDSATGNLSFAGTSAYRVGGNKYAFQFDGDPDYGLFFNQTNVRYEFRNSTAAPIFYIGANDGNSVFSGGVQIGNSSLANAGNLRWTGTDFQGYNGSTWVSLTSGGGGAETDPEVGANTTSFVPRWNGTALVAGHLQDNGSRIGINKAPETEYRFAALRQQTSGSFAATIYAAIKGENNLTNSSTINSVGYLGVNNPGGIYPFIFPDLSVADIGILGVKENSTTEGAGVFAWNRGTAVTANYGLYAAATGSAGNKYGVYAKALGTGAVNRAIYAEASGATFNYALIVPENGGNAGFGWTAPSATLGAK